MDFLPFLSLGINFTWGSYTQYNPAKIPTLCCPMPLHNRETWVENSQILFKKGLKIRFGLLPKLHPIFHSLVGFESQQL
jgi:hypothetical protein